MHKFLLTTSLGLEALVKHEVKKQGGEITLVHDKAIYFQWEIEQIARMNIWSRFGNILYYVLDSRENVTDFDTYFDMIFSQDWRKYIPKWFSVHIKATSIKSELWSTSTLQALGKKAIAKKLVWEGRLLEDESIWKIEVRILMENNTLRVLLNSSWAGLHKRWYREMTWDAPMKENLAAALVVLSGWKYKEPLYDIFCGSGTIAIEAAMIARNIAPWRRRKFSFEKWEWLPSNLLIDEISSAEAKEFKGMYQIYSTDIRKDIQQLALRNASFAGVGDTITFWSQDYKTYLRREIEGTLVSNPPYWLRLEDTNIDQIHEDISKLFEQNKNLSGWVITAFPDFEKLSKTKYKKRKLYNGWEMCYFYKKE